MPPGRIRGHSCPPERISVLLMSAKHAVSSYTFVGGRGGGLGGVRHLVSPRVKKNGPQTEVPLSKPGVGRTLCAAGKQ